MVSKSTEELDEQSLGTIETADGTPNATSIAKDSTTLGVPSADADTTSPVPAKGATPPLPNDENRFAPPTATNGDRGAHPGRFKRFVAGYWRKKLLTIPLTILILIGAALALPASRYPLLGLFLKENLAVVVLDQSSQKPVTKAQVKLGDVTTQTDAKGQATLRSKVGNRQLSVSKIYYKSNNASVLVPVKQKNTPFKVYVTATGRQVPVSVTNKITGKPVAGAEIAAAGSEVKTDKDGKAIIVLPADKPTVTAKVTGDGFNNLAGTIKVSEQIISANNFQLVTAGRIYFLSKASGTINVVKTNLDGSDRQTVLAGTGKESDTDTILLASRDWHFLALKSLRDGGTNPKLFLIDTSSDKLTTMDEGNADFAPVGWADHRFAYTVYRHDYTNWQPKAQALKTYDADSAKLTTIDETDAEGTGQYDYAFDAFSSVYIIQNDLVYTKTWDGSCCGLSHLNGKQVSVYDARTDGSGKKNVKDFPVPDNHYYYALQMSLYEAGGIYIKVPADAGGTSTYYEYEDGKVSPKPDVTDQQFAAPYPTFLASPSAKQTFWADPRDGKNALFIGDADGENGKQIADLSEYTPYGWYSDNYVLVSKNSSELYIMPASGGTPIKISDYHKPNYNFRGYGGGYGGF